MVQIISLVGSLFILGAFIAAQLGRMKTSDLSYVLLNVIGSAILAVIAAIERQWGFLLLEGVWAVVSLWSLIKLLGGRSNPLPH